MTEVRHWSYSALSTYLLRCSLQYRFRYIDKLEPERSSSAMGFGSSIHRALEIAYRDWKPDEPPPLAIAQETLEADLAIRLQDPILEFKDGETPEGLIEKGKGLLAAWAEQAVYEEVIATEQEFRVPVEHPVTGESLGVDLTGVVDLLVRVPGQEAPLVVDFKTSARKYSDGQLFTDLQARVYAFSMRRLHGGDLVPMRWDVLVKTKKPYLQKIEFVKGPEEDLRVFELVKAAEKGVAAGVFHPNDGSMWCNGCAYSNACALWQDNPNAFPPDAANDDTRRSSCAGTTSSATAP